MKTTDLMIARGRGACPVCKKVMGLNAASGMLRIHGTVCPGSGKPPLRK